MAEKTELRVQKNDLANVTIVTEPIPALGEGEALLEVERFAVTANNVTYGIVGDRIGYWQFFPVPDDGQGIIPVWGFGRVISTSSDQVEVGERVYGYFPMGTHLTIKPLRKGGTLIDTADHRAHLPPAYNAYRLTAEEPEAAQQREDARAVLFPLFATSYIIADWLQENDHFGAEQVVVTSASSKTSFGTGMMLKHVGSPSTRIGVTSERNKAFTESLGAFDQVLTYDKLASIPNKPTALVDMSGNADVISGVHNHLGENVKNSAIVGVTHWEAPRQSTPLPGAKPEMFFAPGQIQKRDQELGRGILMNRALEAWASAADSLGDLFSYEVHEGAEATKEIWQKTVHGQVSPTTGMLATMKGA
ncbi:MAG: DUF2855 family protein [Pseudomonadota bacterium]